MRITTHEQLGEQPGSDGPGPGEADLSDLSAERGISESVLVAAGIDVAPRGGERPGWWRIPYPNRMGVWKYRYRNPDPGAGGPKYADSPGAGFHLYNPLRLGPGEEEVWFTEGEFDCLALIDQGLKAIGIHGASNIGAEEKDEDKPTGKFKTEWRLLFEDTLCVVMFDNDEAGAPAGRRLARGLGGVAFDDWDPRFSDVNEWHAADGEGLAAALGGFRARVRSSRGLE